MTILLIILCACDPTDGAAGENDYIYHKLNEFRVDCEDGSKKPTFDYRIAGVGSVCRAAWILCAGFPNRNNSRVRSLEATIRSGKRMAPRKERRIRSGGLDSTSHAIAFLKNYILNNSQRSPVHTEM